MENRAASRRSDNRVERDYHDCWHSLCRGHRRREGRHHGLELRDAGGHHRRCGTSRDHDGVIDEQLGPNRGTDERCCYGTWWWELEIGLVSRVNFLHSGIMINDLDDAIYDMIYGIYS